MLKVLAGQDILKILSHYKSRAGFPFKARVSIMHGEGKVRAVNKKAVVRMFKLPLVAHK